MDYGTLLLCNSTSILDLASSSSCDFGNAH